MLAFSAIRNNDKVGLVLFTDRGRAVHPAAQGAAATCCASSARSSSSSPRHRGTDLAARARLREPGRPSSRDRLPAVRLPAARRDSQPATRGVRAAHAAPRRIRRHDLVALAAARPARAGAARRRLGRARGRRERRAGRGRHRQRLPCAGALRRGRGRRAAGAGAALPRRRRRRARARHRRCPICRRCCASSAARAGRDGASP